MDIALSIVVPTLNRPTLRRTLQSIRDAGAGPQDEVIVVWGDGGDPTAVVDSVEPTMKDRIILAKATPKPDYGNTQKTAGMRAATGTHVAFMDDDDVYKPGAFQKIRQELLKNPGLPHQFQVWIGPPHNRKKWKEPKVVYGQILTSGIVVPNDPRLPSWPIRGENGKLTPWGETGNDVIFAQECEKLFGGFVFCHELISVWRP